MTPRHVLIVTLRDGRRCRVEDVTLSAPGEDGEQRVVGLVVTDTATSGGTFYVDSSSVDSLAPLTLRGGSGG